MDDTQQLATAFIEQYYTILHSEPQSASRIFSKTATIVVATDNEQDTEDESAASVQEYSGATSIAEYFSTFTPAGTSMQITFLKGSPGPNGSVFVNVTGYMSTDSEVATKCSQTFLVSPTQTKSGKVRHLCSHMSLIFFASMEGSQLFVDDDDSAAVAAADDGEVAEEQDEQQGAVAETTVDVEAFTEALAEAADQQGQGQEQEQEQEEAVAEQESVVDAAAEQGQDALDATAADEVQDQVESASDAADEVSAAAEVVAPVAAAVDVSPKAMSWASMARTNNAGTASVATNNTPAQVVVPRSKAPAAKKSAGASSSKTGASSSSSAAAAAGKGASSSGGGAKSSSSSSTPSGPRGPRRNQNSSSGEGAFEKAGPRRTQKPRTRHPPEQSLFVKDVPENATNDDLKSVFGGFGKIELVDIFSSAKGPRKFANVVFAESSSVKECLKPGQSFEVCGSSVSVDRRRERPFNAGAKKRVQK